MNIKALTLCIVILFPLGAVAEFSLSVSKKTIYDDVNNLSWYFVQPEDYSIDVALQGLTWDMAISTCNSLNVEAIDNWRLPNIKELLSVVDFNSDKGLSPLFFDKVSENGHSYPFKFWSSTSQLVYDYLDDLTSIPRYIASSAYYISINMQFLSDDIFFVADNSGRSIHMGEVNKDNESFILTLLCVRDN